MTKKIEDPRIEANKLAWAKRFQSFGKMYWHEARKEEGKVDYYLNTLAKQNYRRARITMGIEEDELLF